MSVATKQELEAVIGALWNDVAKTRASMREETLESDAEWRRGYMDACTGMLELIGIAVKTYRLHIPVEEGEMK